MITKKEDGYYYNKIVTWKKKPNYFKMFYGLVILLIGILCFKPLIINKTPEAIHLLSFGHVMVFIFGSIIITIGPILSGFFLFIFSFGEGKKVKYRRIGK